MNWKINSIRNKLLFSFGLFSLLILILASLSFFNYIHETRINKLNSKLNKLHTDILKLIQFDDRLLDLEKMDSAFFLGKSSSFLVERNEKYNAIDNNLQHVKNELDDEELVHQIELIDSTVHLHEVYVDLLIEKIQQRGFKDYGLEGEMRKMAHTLENWLNKSTLQLEILQLRRHEKDYFLRKETEYVDQFNERAELLIGDLNQYGYADYSDEAERYREVFNEIVILEREIGIDYNTGLRKSIKDVNELLEREFLHLIMVTGVQSQVIYTRNTFNFIMLVICSLLATVVLSVYISKNLGIPLISLAGNVKEYIRSDFSKKLNIEVKSDTIEIQQLATAFKNLISTIEYQLEEIKDQSAMLEEQNMDLVKVNEELDLFVYSAAHDLKSPLASFNGLISIMKLELNDPKYSDYFDRLDDSIRRLESFIQDIVDYGKNKRQELTYNQIDLKELVEDIFENYRYLENFNEVEKDVDYDSDAPFVTDEKRLSIILNNLISNSLRYYNPNQDQPYIDISISITEEKAEIIIRDNGLGIGKEHLDKIFKMFYRAHNHSNGSGLGLFIVMESINKLNGQIRVNSEEGKGTEFSLVLPNHLYKLTEIQNSSNAV